MPPLSRFAVRAALSTLVVAAALGTWLLWSKALGFGTLAWGWRAAHGQMLVFGGLTQIVFGVAYWILPRFDGGTRRGREVAAHAAVAILNGAVLATAVAPLLPGLHMVAAVLLLLAFPCFAWHAWPRVRPTFLESPGMRSLVPPLGAAMFFTATATATAAPIDAPALYRSVCAECHGPERLGLMGPALLPANLGRLKRDAAAQVIRDGRPATQMLPWATRLNAAEIDALVNYIYTPPAVAPVWSEVDIVRSRIMRVDPATAPVRPLHAADPLNLFVVVEAGDHHATILDGDAFTPLERFATRFALHGGPKFSPDGRYVYFASRDGWIAKYDLFALTTVAEVRAGIHTRNLAISHDGRTLLVGNDLPHTLVLLDATDLQLVQVLPAQSATGVSSRVSAVYQAEPRRSFIVALKDVPELLELPIPTIEGNRQARRIYGHGPFTEEMLRAAAPLLVRHVPLPGILDAFFFDPSYRYVIGAEQGTGHVDVVDLDSGAVAAKIDLPGLPHLGSGISWRRDGKLLLATPNLQRGAVTVVDAADWSVVTEVTTGGPGFFMRSHEGAPDAWVDASLSPAKDTLTLIDKRSLRVRATLTPAPGRTVSHVEFDRSGRHALVSLYEDDGALIVYDAHTLQEVKRLPMRKPSGKYNVFNKISRSEGTSH